MKVPIYVVTGFLDAGKTTFLKKLLNHPKWGRQNILVIQFEHGVEEFYDTYNHCQKLKFTTKQLDQDLQHISNEIRLMITSYSFDEIWIEWNSMTSFHTLLSLLCQPEVRDISLIHKVLHLADAHVLPILLGQTGNAILEQIAESNVVLVRNVDSKQMLRNIMQKLRALNPGVAIHPYENNQEVIHVLRKNPYSSVHGIAMLLALAYVLLFMFARNLETQWNIPLTSMINVFIGYLLQGMPFLLIGVLLSSFIQVFISQDLIERYFPKSFCLGMVVALLGGFCLPVCDCASIPIFRSLLKKGIPTAVAITFLMATPVINPVVIVSTYYAFNGDLQVVFARIGLGIVAAVIIGLVFQLWPSKEPILSGGMLELVMCNCDLYSDNEDSSLSARINLFLRHAKSEFFHVGSYLIIGIWIAAMIQAMKPALLGNLQGNFGLAVSIAIMMIAAFILSLCSSSDAVVSRGFLTQFPLGSLMGFLVFGPMMDVKNIMMLSYAFTKSFIIKLLAVTATVCFIVVFIYTVLI